MPTTATMTIRVSSETKRKLERLAADTRRCKSFLAAEAVSAYVERELEIIDGSGADWPTWRPGAWFPMTRPWRKSRP